MRVLVIRGDATAEVRERVLDDFGGGEAVIAHDARPLHHGHGRKHGAHDDDVRNVCADVAVGFGLADKLVDAIADAALDGLHFGVATGEVLHGERAVLNDGHREAFGVSVGF